MQNHARKYGALAATREEVNRDLKKVMELAFRNVWLVHEKRNVSLRTAAYMLAVHRVSTVAKERDKEDAFSYNPKAFGVELT
jgi:glutamate dehydrogenase/leucine dehydrogenase